MTNQEFNIKLEIIKQALISIGFSADDANPQIAKIGDIVSIAIITRLLKEKPDIKDKMTENFEELLEQNFSPKYIKQVTQEESGKIVGEYLTEITKNFPEDKKRVFFTQIKQV